MKGTRKSELPLMYIDSLQHKGTMSTKPVIEKIAKLQRSYLPLCGHTTFVLLTPACTMTNIDKITIFCNDVNNTSTSVEFLQFYITCQKLVM